MPHHGQVLPDIPINEAFLDCRPPAKGKSAPATVVSSPAHTTAMEMMFSPTMLRPSCMAKYSITASTFSCRPMYWPQLAGISVLMDVINLCLERNVLRRTRMIVKSTIGSNSPSNNPPLRSKPVAIPIMHHVFSSTPWPGKVTWSNSLQQAPQSKSPRYPHRMDDSGEKICSRRSRQCLMHCRAQSVNANTLLMVIPGNLSINPSSSATWGVSPIPTPFT